MSFVDIENGDSQFVKERDLQEAQKVVAGSIPLIEAAPSLLFDLPRGRHSADKWETEVELRELTGSDEEALARFNDTADFFYGVLVYGTARI